jgi:hypothetical protein
MRVAFYAIAFVGVTATAFVSLIALQRMIGG